MKDGKFADKPAARRDVVPGDAVYYQHPKHGMVHGEVSAVGKDGFRARHTRDGGGEDAVLWSQMLGHKLRKQRRFTVVDRGEDGAICKDEEGNTVFLGGEQPEPMQKSLTPVAGPGEDFRTLALELARSQMETATMLVSAMDRMTQAVYAQSTRLDQLIALQVAALNSGEPHAGAVYQEHQATEAI